MCFVMILSLLIKKTYQQEKMIFANTNLIMAKILYALKVFFMFDFDCGCQSLNKCSAFETQLSPYLYPYFTEAIWDLGLRPYFYLCYAIDIID